MPFLAVANAAVNAAASGFTSNVYKPSVAAATAGGWVDASMSAGTPIYNAYVGSQLEATPLVGAGNRGMYVGPAGEKYLLTAMLQTRSAVVPAYALILDYLMFYPLVDLDSVDVQTTTAAASLPRYADGTGVQIMPVVTLPNTAATDCTVVYTNEKGVSGRVSTFELLIGATTGSIAASANLTGAAGSNSPFIPLASGDAGVRSIESVTIASGVGGFACFVLVKPIASVVIPELNTCSEISFLADRFSLPRVQSGAFLNFIIKTNASATSSWMGQFTFVNA